jgi:cold shock CspA family protein
MVIADDAGGPDMFLHITALHSADIDPDNLHKGERLIFDVENIRDGKTKASNVRRPESGEMTQLQKFVESPNVYVLRSNLLPPATEGMACDLTTPFNATEELAQHPGLKLVFKTAIDKGWAVIAHAR